VMASPAVREGIFRQERPAGPSRSRSGLARVGPGKNQFVWLRTGAFANQGLFPDVGSSPALMLRTPWCHYQPEPSITNPMKFSVHLSLHLASGAPSRGDAPEDAKASKALGDGESQFGRQHPGRRDRDHPSGAAGDATFEVLVGHWPPPRALNARSANHPEHPVRGTDGTERRHDLSPLRTPSDDTIRICYACPAPSAPRVASTARRRNCIS